VIIWEEFHVHGNRELAEALNALSEFGRRGVELTNQLNVRLRKLELQVGLGEGRRGPKGKLP
jgi:hypothetical protein